MSKITDNMIKIIIFPMVILLTSAVSLKGQSSDSWKFIIYGDTRSNDSDHRSVLQSITENTPDYKFIINVGDVVEDGTNTKDWEKWQDACNDVLGGTGQDIVPPKYMAVPGNHDNFNSSEGRNNWQQYLSGQNEQFGNGGEFFVLDYENARLILLNSDTDITNEQRDMLNQAIANNTKTWLFAVWHHPIFPFGAKSYADKIHDNWGVPLYNGGADIIFTGHAHYYARSEKLQLNGQEYPPLEGTRGTAQIISGNGGAPLYTVDPGSNAYMLAGTTDEFGYTELTVEGNILKLRHITDNGVVVDEEIYTANPKAGNANDYIISASGENPPDETKENAFDGDVNTKWLTFSNSAWIQYDFRYAGDGAKVINEYALTSANDSPERDPRDWNLLGSNDGSNWTILDSRKGETFSNRLQTKNYSFNNVISFNIYRLDLLSNYDPESAYSTQIAGIEFIESEQLQPALSLSKSIYELDETLVVNYSGLPGNATDWVGIYLAGTSDDSYLKYIYTYGAVNGTMLFNDLATPGNYEARLYFSDSYNMEYSASFIVAENVIDPDSGGHSNNPPVVTITDPDDGTTFMPGESITFSANAADPEEGDMCADIEWTSDLDGWLGSGCTFNTSSLSENTHVITASVTDSGGVSGSDHITIVVGEQVMVDNLILPANGGFIESFTSEYGSGWFAADITNGITNEDGWSSVENPGHQEFIYSFREGQRASLSEAVIHTGTAEGTYFSKDVEVWISADGNNFTKTAAGTLQNAANSSLTLKLKDNEARKVKLVVTSGYRDDYWEIGEFEVFGVMGITSSEDLASHPADYVLMQNYPNPFNPSTTISYNIAEKTHVSIKVYDILGSLAATLVDEVKSQGSYSLTFSARREDGSDLPSGTYILQMRAGYFMGQRKMMLIK